MKLNLGCGSNLLPGYVNVDKHGAPDQVVDLERFPWPWETSSQQEVVLIHVLEHLGPTPDVFIGVMKELYRVCAPGATVTIVVPHPRHDHFLGDPTHVRVIAPETLSLFSKAKCRQWAAEGAANSPLALYHDIDFEMVEMRAILAPRYREALEARELSEEDIHRLLEERNNVATEYHLVLKALK